MMLMPMTLLRGPVPVPSVRSALVVTLSMVWPLAMVAGRMKL